VFPEDIENALDDAGLPQAVVVETKPGRIEAIVLSPDAPAVVTASMPAVEAPKTEAEFTALRKRIEPIIREANSHLSQHQRIDDFRIWPDADFPRTHTLKIKRSEVQRWAAADVPLTLQDSE